MIFEEAKARCGNSEAALEAAVARGAIKKRPHNGEVLYYFPNVVVGESEKVTESQSVSKGKAVSQTSCKALQNVISGLSWAISDGESGSSNQAYFVLCATSMW